MKGIMRISFLIGFTFWNYSAISQDYNWIPLSSTVNGMVYKLVEYDGQLIAGGTFTTAGGNPAKSIASWNGSAWSNLGDGIINTNEGSFGWIFDMAVFHDSLFVVGAFDLAGGSVANNIAVWDGTNWSTLGTGSNAVIEAIEIFNDELYVAGEFDTIGGIPARGIAKWNGTNWENLGAGLRFGTNGQSVFELKVYGNKLFATGVIDSAGNIECNNVAYWDGSIWATIPVYLTPAYRMIVWNYELLFAMGGFDSGADLTVEVKAWDGTGSYMFSWEPMSNIIDFAVFNDELYSGGGDYPYNYGNVVRKWNGTNWVPAGSGLNDAVHTLCNYNNELYAGGSFTVSGGSESNYLARYAELNSVPEYTSGFNFTLYPNPANTTITLFLETTESTDFSLEISDLQGKVIYSHQLNSSAIFGDQISLNIDFLQPGLYFIKLANENGSVMKRLVKQ